MILALFSSHIRRVRPGLLPLLALLTFILVTAPAWRTAPEADLSPLPTHRVISPDEDGGKIYRTRCVSCHQNDGMGISGVFPPLSGTEWVVSDKGRLIRIVLHGLSGETVVQGITYSGAMPPWNSYLNDEQIAAVLTFIRSSWNNDADAVTTDDVTKVRAATQDRKKSWTHDELMDEANQGIPGSAMPNFGIPVDGQAPPDSTKKG